MPWIRIDDHAPEHPKLLKAGLEATGLWVRILAYCSRYLTDGAVPPDAVRYMGGKHADKITAVLVDCGLLDTCEGGGFRVHDYHEYQPSRSQVTERRARTKAKVDEWRRRKGYACNQDVTRLHTDNQPVSNRAPVPVPVPVPKEPKRVCALPPRLVQSTKHLAHAGFVQVPGFLHAELLASLGSKLGGADPDKTLRDWYGRLDEAVEASGEPIPDQLAFIRQKFKEWVTTGRREEAAPRMVFCSCGARNMSDWTECEICHASASWRPTGGR